MVTKWGFGAAPLKRSTEYQYKKALAQVSRYVRNETIANEIDICNEISIAKGLFNRILKQDQWDWFTVNMYLDYPPIGHVSRIANKLNLLRKETLAQNEEKVAQLKSELRNSGFLTYAQNFVSFSFDSDCDEYIYILSRREEKDVLKIGKTTRNVLKRCQEINSATGVIYPYAPRKVYRVIDSDLAERLVHERLREYRIRMDREFFLISYQDACKLIEECLVRHNLFFYKY